MTQTVNAEIIAIGTEILLGEITDTNSVYIARSLRDIGVNLYYMTSVGDNENRIEQVIRTALARADIVITCGGLGPTVDDMTRQGVAAATDRGLTFHQELLDKIEERFAGFRMQMTDNNRRQAYLPHHATIVENPVGTAPAFIVEHDARVIISLPGVPREMKYLMNERVIPFLKERYKLGDTIIKARVLRTAGIGESALDAAIGAELLHQSNPTVGLAAHSGQVDVRITAKADSKASADVMIAAIETLIRARVGQYIFGIDDEQIETVVVSMLIEKGLKLAVSATGISNPIGQHIQTLLPTQNVLINTQVYPTIGHLQAAMSEHESLPIRELAERTASMICQQMGTSAGIAIISQHDKDEFHDDSEPGTAFAVYLDGKLRSRSYGFGGRSGVAAEWANTWSMSMLWRMLQEKFNME